MISVSRFSFYSRSCMLKLNESKSLGVSAPICGKDFFFVNLIFLFSMFFLVCVNV